MGYSPWGRKELDTTERLTCSHHSLSKPVLAFSYSFHSCLCASGPPSSLRAPNHGAGRRFYSYPFHWVHCLKVEVKWLSRVRLCDPWTVAHQAPRSMGFSRQEYWSGLPFPPPGDLPDPGIEPRSPRLQPDALTSAPPGKPLNTRMQSLRKPPIETQNFRSKY